MKVKRNARLAAVQVIFQYYFSKSDIKKIISLLRDNKINYSDLNSEPFLIVSSYSSNFMRIGLDKRNLFSLS